MKALQLLKAGLFFQLKLYVTYTITVTLPNLI